MEAEVRLRAEHYGSEPTQIQARVIRLERAQRWKRAARIFVLLLAAAVATALIPGLHLIAPPSLLIMAVVLGLRRLRQTQCVEALVGTCPACREDQSLPAPSQFQLPLTLRCPGCGEFLKLLESK